MHPSVRRESLQKPRMVLKPLRLFLLLFPLLLPSWAESQSCLTSASTCSQCIRSGPQCAWCTVPHLKLRCNTVKGLSRAGCLTHYMYNPQGNVQVTRNDSRTQPTAETLHLQPQEVSLRLRPGVRQSFPLSITMARDHPITDLIMDTSPVPAGFNVTLGSIIHGYMLVEVKVGANLCLDLNQNQNGTGPWSVHLSPRGFPQSVKLVINLECECDCAGNREENSPTCNSHGALACGSCECYPPYTGQKCQIDTESTFSRDEKFCRSGPNAPFCSGRGTCDGGFCVCNSRENPEERYSGEFCQCSNFDCPYHNNRICGGHGKCECGQCVCNKDWTDENCGCSMDTALCMASNQQLCNGRGSCLCGTCMCNPPYMGPTCELCPTCLGLCQQHAECVECRVFGTGSKKDRCEDECSYLILTKVQSKEDISAPCKMISREDSCFFYYSISYTPSGTYSTVAADKECRQTLGK
ncbi:integrin beta-1-like isoform X2 [Dunckerocampus dactyliophorus]|uniref:integrin beta-1-like isoform X2 n=1 Tax=Dunckerocampus dactyliophorus TaxID=161453 RepID=UPI0024060C60|nr:integrin beta-1-like isoform X2 [Dunckerocampus dactyliophorus]